MSKPNYDKDWRSPFEVFKSSKKRKFLKQAFSNGENTDIPNSLILSLCLCIFYIKLETKHVASMTSRYQVLPSSGVSQLIASHVICCLQTDLVSLWLRHKRCAHKMLGIHMATLTVDHEDNAAKHLLELPAMEFPNLQPGCDFFYAYFKATAKEHVYKYVKLPFIYSANRSRPVNSHFAKNFELWGCE